MLFFLNKYEINSYSNDFVGYAFKDSLSKLYYLQFNENDLGDERKGQRTDFLNFFSSQKYRF